jgi:enoyl-CoA hydratase/carnithine racemase
MPSELITERRGTTLVLTISDPPTRNTLSAQAIAAGIEALGACESDDRIRAVVLRGEGAHFCSGGNLQGLRERRAAGRETQLRMLEQLHHFVETIRAHPKPVIAAVEGAAAGAGFSLALACDLIVAAVDARFVMSYGKVGLTPDGGATWSLSRALPRSLALQAIWLGEPLSSETLRGHGLVAAIAPTGNALDEALRFADQLAAMAPNAVAGAKELVEQASGHAFVQQLHAERDRFLDALFHANGAEGLQAFIDRRAPRFS